MLVRLAFEVQHKARTAPTPVDTTAAASVAVNPVQSAEIVVPNDRAGLERIKQQAAQVRAVDLGPIVRGDLVRRVLLQHVAVHVCQALAGGARERAECVHQARRLERALADVAVHIESATARAHVRAALVDGDSGAALLQEHGESEADRAAAMMATRWLASRGAIRGLPLPLLLLCAAARACRRRETARAGFKLWLCSR
jgi:hypothetical protein